MDWMDVILHVLGALVIVLGAALLFDWSPLAAWTAAAFNAVLWPAREWWQDVRRGTSPPWPFRHSTQKVWEAYAPAVAGVLAAMAVSVEAVGLPTHAGEKARFAMVLDVQRDGEVEMLLNGVHGRLRLEHIERINDRDKALRILRSRGMMAFIKNGRALIMSVADGKDMNLKLVCEGAATPLESAPFGYLVCEAQRRVDEMADRMGGLIDADSPDR